MKSSFSLIALISLQLFFQISCVYFLEYTSQKKSSSNSYKDLLDISVECPHYGVLKNFAVNIESNQVWYDFSCYSSFSDANENDESVIKGLDFSNSQTFKYAMTDSIDSLGKIDFICPVDFALNKFTLTKNSNNYIVAEYKCMGVKSSSQTKANTIHTEPQDGDANSLKALVGLRCGNTTPESDELPGNALKGFKFIVSNSSGKTKVEYAYSIQTLRSIKDERTLWGQKSKTLRDSNTQKN